MRFVVTGEWTRNRLLKAIVCCFLVYTAILWVTNFGLYFAKMSLSPASVVEYFLGNEEKFAQPRSLIGLLEQLHFHSFAMGILLLTLTHLLLFVPLSMRFKAWTICLAFGSGISGELAGWGVRYVHPVFAYLKVGSFVLLQTILFVLIVTVFLALWRESPSAYSDGNSSPT
jgi:hypothetical protein